MSTEFAEELNKLYLTDPEQYMNRLNEIKDEGYKVFRSSSGDHKVMFDWNRAYGGVFGKFFGGNR